MTIMMMIDWNAVENIARIFFTIKLFLFDKRAVKKRVDYLHNLVCWLMNLYLANFYFHLNKFDSNIFCFFLFTLKINMYKLSRIRQKKDFFLLVFTRKQQQQKINWQKIQVHCSELVFIIIIICFSLKFNENLKFYMTYE